MCAEIKESKIQIAQGTLTQVFCIKWTKHFLMKEDLFMGTWT